MPLLKVQNGYRFIHHYATIIFMVHLNKPLADYIGTDGGYQHRAEWASRASGRRRSSQQSLAALLAGFDTSVLQLKALSDTNAGDRDPLRLSQGHDSVF
ncbi:hypothetical protein EVAR_3976_1 [Eumeta japonica]|uniref:Uncharacterized protein n=1 Tax=Eumeta variegata TaxID=151549 RepID=A0A4C1STK3_EUMVA|nr:hypothetical protein EVAR_3976_1 [Eumeta japonica]